MHNFGGLVAVRLVLGMCEGGLLPGMILYLSTMYKRHELQLRYSPNYDFIAVPNFLKGWHFLRFRIHIRCIRGYVIVYCWTSLVVNRETRSFGIWHHEDEWDRWFGRMALDFYP